MIQKKTRKMLSVPENVSKNLTTKVPKLSKNCNNGFICPLDKICNPQTGRCVGLSGKLGQSLQNEASAVKSKKKIKVKDTSTKKSKRKIMLKIHLPKKLLKKL